jgi:hypothetical protein
MIQLWMSSTFFQVYYYYPFSAVSDSAKLYNDLRWNVTRPQGFEAVMRVRCSQVVFLVHWHFFLCKLLYSWYLSYCSKLILFPSFIGYSSSRIPWKLLQTHPDRCWPTWGLYIYIMFDYHWVISIWHSFLFSTKSLMLQNYRLFWPAITLKSRSF